MKVLFLDIDGVLNSMRTAIANGGFPHDFSKPGQFDMTAIGLIRKLCVETDTKIVLSSTWRILDHYLDCGLYLNLPIIDATPVCNSFRGHEIKAWLDMHPEVSQYAIVDDDDDMLEEQKPFFVNTNVEEGLMYKDYKQLRAILGGYDGPIIC